MERRDTTPVGLGWCQMSADFAVKAEHSIVEALRPRPDQRVLAAVFSTYSLDLVALLSALLGLSGLDCTEFDADPVDLNRSLFRFNKKVIVLCQRGRIRCPKSVTRARTLSALDRTVVEIPFDERKKSWHAKLALVAYGEKTTAREPAEWRLWIGSRNLTQSNDLDIGLMLVGTPAKNGEAKEGSRIPGLVTSVMELLRPGGERVRHVLSLLTAEKTLTLDTLITQLLHKVRWWTPRGVAIDRISARGLQGDLSKALSSFGVASNRDVLLAAPFVDFGGLEYLNTFLRLSPTKKATLVSMSATLDNMQPAPPSLNLRSSDFAPTQQVDSEPILPDEAVPNENLEDPVIPCGRGLHAKLALITGPKTAPTLVLGSANLTRRGLKGPNAELIVRARISKAHAQALKKVLLEELSQEYVRSAIDPETERLDAIKQRLDAIRKVIAADLELVWDIFADHIVLRASCLPVFNPTEMRLDVAPFARPELGQPWPIGKNVIAFEGLTEAEQGELVLFTLTDTANGEAISWAQKACLTDQKHLDVRDDALAAELLTVQGVLRIIQAEFAGNPGIRGIPWHTPPRRRSTKRLLDDALSDLHIEELLRSRARNPQWSAELLARVEGTLNTLLENATADDHGQINAFLRIWRPFVAAFGRNV